MTTPAPGPAGSTPATAAAGPAGGSAPTTSPTGAHTGTPTGAASSAAQQTPGASPPPTAKPNSLAEDTLAALQTVMAAEHAALWAYGLVAAFDPAAAPTVTSMVTAHQDVRDVAANLIVQGGGTPVGPAPAYTTPKPVTDPASALALAVVIESDCAAAWRSVIGSTDDSTLRGTALSALTDCAMRMVTWRQTAKDKIVTVPFPGDPALNG